MSDDKPGTEVQQVSDTGDLPAETSIKLGQTNTLDLAGLSDDQINELKTQYAEGMLDVHRKASELKVDVAALDAALGSFNNQTAQATKAGAHSTITHTQTSSAGRTEIVVGNTETAAKAKLSNSARGLPDRTLLYVGIGAAVAVIIALIFANG